MDDFSIEKAITSFVDSPDFFEDFIRSLKSVKDFEKKVKLYETLLGYRMSKFKTVDKEDADRYRPIKINYTVADGSSKSISNQEPEEP